MTLTGEMLIGAASVRGNEGQQRAFNPTTNAHIAEPVYGMGGAAEVERAATLAAAAFDPYRALPLEQRAAFLDAIAENILALGDALIERAHAETGLPVARLQGERGRTVGQLRLFARGGRKCATGKVLTDGARDKHPIAVHHRARIRRQFFPLRTALNKLHIVPFGV